MIKKFSLLIRSGDKLFAIKVESCQKSRQIMDVFYAIQNFRGGDFQNFTPILYIITPASRYVA